MTVPLLIYALWMLNMISNPACLITTCLLIFTSVPLAAQINLSKCRISWLMHTKVNQIALFRVCSFTSDFAPVLPSVCAMYYVLLRLKTTEFSLIYMQVMGNIFQPWHCNTPYYACKYTITMIKIQPP